MNGIFFEFQKADDEQRIVSGYASTEAVDMAGEIVSKQAIAEALNDFMKFGNVREMHVNSAAGVVEKAVVDEKGLYITAKVVDDSAWSKVKAGVYKGFSIGGRVLSKVGNTITKLLLTEISLVDRPCNPEAVFDLYKMADSDMNEALIKQICSSVVEEALEKLEKDSNKNSTTEIETTNEETQMENSAKTEDLVKAADTSKLDELSAKLEKALDATSKILDQSNSLIKQNEELKQRITQLEQQPADAKIAISSIGTSITKAQDSGIGIDIKAEYDKLEEQIKNETNDFEKGVLAIKQVHLLEPTPAFFR
jgi:phage head maturation protease